MATIRTAIELEDRFSGVLDGIVNAVNMSVSVMERMQAVMNSSVDASALGGVREHADRAAGAVRELNDALQGVRPLTPVLGQPQTAEIPVYRQSDTVDVFANRGAERFEREARSANNMLNTLNQAQTHIAAEAAGIFSPNEATDMNGMQERLQAIRQQISAIENNPLNMGSGAANAVLERLRGRLELAAREKEMLDRAAENIYAGEVKRAAESIDVGAFYRAAESMCAGAVNRAVESMGVGAVDRAVERMDVGAVNRVVESMDMGADNRAAESVDVGIVDRGVESMNVGAVDRAVESIDVGALNQAYLRLSQTVGDTERYIRDNVDKQGRFNRVIGEGVGYAEKLNSVIAGAVGGFVGADGIKNAFGCLEDCTPQLNVEARLIGVLANTLDVSRVELEAAADTAGAVSEINAVQKGVDEVAVPVSVSVKSGALAAAFGQIAEKASEIQIRGIYGDEAVIAAETEFAVYLGDTDAVEMMTDALADRAADMSGSVEIAPRVTVNYGADLDKLMSGSYDTITNRGFEISDTRKAIVEGMAAQAGIAAALGEEYAHMFGGMQAAVSRVIEKSWLGLYESMSNTPESKFIQLNEAWGDMNESIGGRLFSTLADIIGIVDSDLGNIGIVIQGVINGLDLMIGVLGEVVGAAAGAAGSFSGNRSAVEPVIMGMAMALGVYYTAMLLYNDVTGISTAITAANADMKGAHAAAVTAEAAAINASAAAQIGFNAALSACPLVWIIALIISITVIIYNVCEAVSALAGIANGGFGAICGGIDVVIRFFEYLGLSAANTAVGIWNAVSACAVGIGAAFDNALLFMREDFWSFADVMMQGLKFLAEFADACIGRLGVNVDTSGLDLARDKIRELKARYGELESPAEAFSEGAAVFNSLRDKRSENVFNFGVAWGGGTAYDIGSVLDGLGFGGLSDISFPEDYADRLTVGGVEDMAGSMGVIKDSLELTEEYLKYLRDTAEQETVNRFTTAEITIEQTNHNTVSGKMDIDGLVEGLTDKMSEAMFIMAEGVHV